MFQNVLDKKSGVKKGLLREVFYIVRNRVYRQLNAGKSVRSISTLLVSVGVA